jgi:hypothetical protein
MENGSYSLYHMKLHQAVPAYSRQCTNTYARLFYPGMTSGSSTGQDRAPAVRCDRNQDCSWPLQGPLTRLESRSAIRPHWPGEQRQITECATTSWLTNPQLEQVFSVTLCQSASAVQHSRQERMNLKCRASKQSTKQTDNLKQNDHD